MAEAATPAAAASSSSGSSGAVRKRLEELKFDNLALRALPVDKETKNYTRQVAGEWNHSPRHSDGSACCCSVAPGSPTALARHAVASVLRVLRRMFLPRRARAREESAPGVLLAGRAEMDRGGRGRDQAKGFRGVFRRQQAVARNETRCTLVTPHSEHRGAASCLHSVPLCWAAISSGHPASASACAD